MRAHLTIAIVIVVSLSQAGPGWPPSETYWQTTIGNWSDEQF